MLRHRNQLSTAPAIQRAAFNHQKVSNFEQQSQSVTQRMWFGLKQRKILSDQIRRTNQNLRVRKFKRFNENNKANNLQKHMQGSFNLELICPDSDSRSFSEFMKRKKVENTYVKNKMRVFGNALTERSKAKIEGEINQLLKKNMEEAQADKTKGISLVKKYMVCHKILENFLQLMTENINHIALKKQFSQIYEGLKGQMIGAIINSDDMAKIGKQIENQLKLLKEQKFEFSRKKMNEIRSKRKPFYLLKEQKKDEITEQIIKTLQRLKTIVVEAFSDSPQSIEVKLEIEDKWRFKFGNKADFLQY